MWPSSHSSRSRTSRKRGASPWSRSSRARPASISSICSLVSWRNSRYDVIAFQFIATCCRLSSERGRAKTHVSARRARRRRRRRTRGRHGRVHADQHRRTRVATWADDHDHARPGTGARARSRRPYRPRGRRSTAREPALFGAQAGGRRKDLRALHVGAGPNWSGACGVAERDGGEARASRRPPPAKRGRPAPSRAGAAGRRANAGRSGRLAAGAGPGPEHAAGAAGRKLAPPELRPRPAAVRADLHRLPLDLGASGTTPARGARARREEWRRSSEAPLRLGAAAARPLGLRRAGVRGGRAARTERCGGSGRSRGRPLLQGQARPRLLPAWALGGSFPALAERPLSPRRVAPLDRTARQVAQRVPARLSTGAAHDAGKDRKGIPGPVEGVRPQAAGPLKTG